MFCDHKLFLLMIIQVLVPLTKVGNCQKYQSVANDEIVPFNLHDNGTMVDFPSIPALKGLRLSVASIDYESRILSTSDPKDCLPRLFLQLHNLSIRPIQFLSLNTRPLRTSFSVTFFNCSSVGSRAMDDGYPPQRKIICPVYVVDSDASILQRDLVSCTKMAQLFSPIPPVELQMNVLGLTWLPSKRNDEKKFRIFLPATASIALLLLLIFCFYVHRYFKKKGDDQLRLEKFLDDYKALRPTRFSYADLKRITSHFKDKLGEGAHGTIFKGKLSTEIQVAVKVLNDSDSDGKEFINEMGATGKIHHINVVRLLGFCADGFHRALIYDFFPNGSLQKFISSPDDSENFLGWLKLHKIALGIAKGIEYLHQGCDYRILHFDINPRNVLLDHDFNPKISDFGLAKLCSKNQSTVSMTAARGTLGYIAPEVFSRNFGNVSYKSDIYSYGMLLLEMASGRKNMDTNQEVFNILYPEWIHNLIEGGDININIEDEDDIKVAKKLAIVGLWCIQWHPINRPSMKTVIQMLEDEIDKLKVPPTPFDFSASANASTITPPRHLNLMLEVIHELE